MNRQYTVLALSAVAMGTVVLTTPQASAMPKEPASASVSQNGPAAPPDWPDEGSGYPGSDTTGPEYNYPNYDPAYEVPAVKTVSAQSLSDDNGVEALQAGVSALGGAAVAFGGMWLYRRRHALAG
ncbi:hypothetical protein E0H75_38495 [Kribbella capetownensis]|uniref:LPXTG cell wall anchor domain-containing protein n=1 Tax=Kribbella capetownensis TaxID=1572659 RepID=A0A4V2M698_9ACTN|nr:hypothetical protein [Kribbella capetownensis]TCC42902.1 hypothetical protein E0H75_38495 [Kribbella capetownensis]